MLPPKKKMAVISALVGKKIFVGTHLTLVLCSMVSRQHHRWQVVLSIVHHV
jgi:hypothetical protein